MGKFIAGFIVGILLLLACGYGFIVGGGVPMNVSSTSLPMERFLANAAISASIGKAAKDQPTVPADETNLLAGAHLFNTRGCAGCHGRIDDPNSGNGKNFYPAAPHLLPPSKGVTDDEVGETHWVVKNGIRFSAMPTYGNRLSETELWQVSLLLHNANKLPESVQAALREHGEGRNRPAPASTPAPTPAEAPSASPTPTEPASAAPSASPTP